MQMDSWRDKERWGVCGEVINHHRHAAVCHILEADRDSAAPTVATVVEVCGQCGDYCCACACAVVSWRRQWRGEGCAWGCAVWMHVPGGDSGRDSERAVLYGPGCMCSALGGARRWSEVGPRPRGWGRDRRCQHPERTRSSAGFRSAYWRFHFLIAPCLSTFSRCDITTKVRLQA